MTAEPDDDVLEDRRPWTERFGEELLAAAIRRQQPDDADASYHREIRGP